MKSDLFSIKIFKHFLTANISYTDEQRIEFLRGLRRVHSSS